MIRIRINQQLERSVIVNTVKEITTIIVPDKPSKSSKEEFHVSAITVANISAEEEGLDPDGWYIDTAAAIVVTNSLVGCTKMVNQEAKLRDWENRESSVQGIGTYELITENGQSLTLDNVVYKSTAAVNFLSWAKLDRTGLFRLAGENGVIQVFSKSTGELVFTGHLVKPNLYKLQLKPKERQVTVDAVMIRQSIPLEVRLKYWHIVLGHCNYSYLYKMATLLGLSGKLKCKISCDVCSSSRAIKHPFDNSIKRADKPFK